MSAQLEFNRAGRTTSGVVRQWFAGMTWGGFDFDVLRDEVIIINKSGVGCLTLTLSTARDLAELLLYYIPDDDEAYQVREDEYES